MGQSKHRVYVGTYTNDAPEPRGRGEGIYIMAFDPTSGALEQTGLERNTPNPSFVTLHPDGSTLYAANEVTELDGEDREAAVSAFAIDAGSGNLTYLNRQPSRGSDPCHVRVDATGRNLLVANYTSGSIAVLPIEAEGSLRAASNFHQHEGSGPNPDRQEGPHAHFITPDPSNGYVLVADLGLDRVLVYQFDAGGHTLTPYEAAAAVLPPGAGPRHLDFHPSAPFVYVINELGSSISTCAWDDGSLRVIETISTLPDGYDGRNSCAEIRVHPSGRFVYGSNRGHDSIAVCAVDESRGTLTRTANVPTGGANPRNFTLDPSGAYLLVANQDSDTIVTFAIDPDSGGLSPTGQVAPVPSPVCVTFGRAY